jgi:hypothetical protein
VKFSFISPTKERQELHHQLENIQKQMEEEVNEGLLM